MTRYKTLLLVLFLIFVLNTGMVFITKRLFAVETTLMELLFFAIFTVNGMAAVLFGYIIYRRYNAGLINKLITTIANIEAGHLSARIDYEELEDHQLILVAHGVNRMAAALEHRTQQLQNMALFDELTALHNRHHFMSRAETELAVALRHHHSLIMLMIDIDYFKKVNDTYGHQLGDVVLKVVAKLLREAVRSSDLIARYGGEEFIVLMPNADETTAMLVATRILTTVRQHIFREFPANFRVTVSIGLAMTTTQDNLDSLIKRADVALYSAKANGRNRIEVDIISNL